jgi:hypothetical protein
MIRFQRNRSRVVFCFFALLCWLCFVSAQPLSFLELNLILQQQKVALILETGAHYFLDEGIIKVEQDVSELIEERLEVHASAGVRKPRHELFQGTLQVVRRKVALYFQPAYVVVIWGEPISQYGINCVDAAHKVHVILGSVSQCQEVAHETEPVAVIVFDHFSLEQRVFKEGVVKGEAGEVF